MLPCKQPVKQCPQSPIKVTMPNHQTVVHHLYRQNRKMFTFPTMRSNSNKEWNTMNSIRLVVKRVQIRSILALNGQMAKRAPHLWATMTKAINDRKPIWIGNLRHIQKSLNAQIFLKFLTRFVFVLFCELQTTQCCIDWKFICWWRRCIEWKNQRISSSLECDQCHSGHVHSISTVCCSSRWLLGYNCYGGNCTYLLLHGKGMWTTISTRTKFFAKCADLSDNIRCTFSHRFSSNVCTNPIRIPEKWFASVIVMFRLLKFVLGHKLELDWSASRKLSSYWWRASYMWLCVAI